MYLCITQQIRELEKQCDVTHFGDAFSQIMFPGN